MIFSSPKTISGKVSQILVILSGTALIFCSYMLYQNFQIQKIQAIKTKHMEAAPSLTFLAGMELTQLLQAIEQAIITMDTTDRAKHCKRMQSDLELHIKVIDEHCKSFGFNNDTTSMQALKDLSILGKDAQKIFSLIAQTKLNPEEAEKYKTEILEIYKTLPGQYWNVFGSVFKNQRKYTDIKELNDRILDRKTTYILYTIGAMLFVLLCISIVSWFTSKNFINKSINSVIVHIDKVSSGDLTSVAVLPNNEVGRIMKSTNVLVNNLNQASSFAESIGKGVFDQPFSPISELDKLGHSLVNMRNELQRFKFEDQQRLWASQGKVHFEELIRTKNENIQLLCDSFLSGIIKYLGINQGCIFLLEEINNEKFLEMKASFAYDRKKYAEKRIAVGEELVGQCFLENEIIYLNQVPQDYVKITSGLGEALPRTLLLVPINVEKDKLGILELASFNLFEDYKIEFIKNITLSFASVIQNVKTQDKTKLLLEDLKNKTEEMRAQEEELRQNLEELMATQEEVARKNTEIETNSAESASIINGINSVMATVEFTPDGYVVSANKLFLKIMKTSLDDIIGKHHKTFVPDEILNSDEYSLFWEKLNDGIAFSDTVKRVNALGDIVWLSAIYTPVLNTQKKVVKVIKYATDVTKQFESTAT